MRACVALLSALVLASCSYDLSAFEQDASAPPADSGGVCDSLSGTGCTAPTVCAASYWTGDMLLREQCTIGGAAPLGTSCNGPGVCATGLACVGTGPTTGTCRALCAATRTCPTELACDREAGPVYTSDRGVPVYLCR